MGKSRKASAQERVRRIQRLRFLDMLRLDEERSAKEEADEACKLAAWNATQTAARWVASERGY